MIILLPFQDPEERRTPKGKAGTREKIVERKANLRLVRTMPHVSASPE
jgi:hypothetical protein